MKNLSTFLYIFLLSVSVYAQGPTFASLPDSSHVLVVYNSLDQTSIAVKNDYVDARNIPGINICPLDDLVESINITYEEVTHRIQLTQQGEIIKDMDNTNSSTIHAWIYFNEKIAIPIANYLETHYVNGIPLTDIIRFIVLCKGVPFRIDSRVEDADSKMQNVICANLLTLLGETIADEEALLFYYNKQTSVPNPYYRVDQNFSMDHFFLPDHYRTTVYIGEQNRDISLSYLVTHLSAPRFEDIQGMIDRSIDAINETDYNWFIDGDPTPCGPNVLGNTASIFNSLGITNYFFDDTEDPITYDPDSIMSYSSNGIWTTVGLVWPCSAWTYFLEDYIQNQLTLKYAAGAFFNTMESHNGLSIGTYPVIRTRQQGLIADFTLMGGTVAVGQAYHSPSSHIIANEDFFPHYTVGYSFIESAYMGMIYLNATNVIVGDPLTRVTYPCEPVIISSNTTITSGDYDCDIIVPEGITLTVISTPSEPVNFKRNASLIIEGRLNIQEGSALNFDSFSELRLDVGYVLEINLNTSINFREHSTFTINDNFVFEEESPFSFEDDCNFVINGEAELSEGSAFNLVNGMSFKVNGSYTLKGGSTLNLHDNSSMTSNGKLKINSGSTLNINNFSKFYSLGTIQLSEGVVINLSNDPTDFEIRGVVKLLGIINNRITFNCLSESRMIKFLEVDTLLIQHTEINSGYLVVAILNGIQKPRLLSISNSIFNNSPQRHFFHIQHTEGVNLTLTDNSFNTGYPNYTGCLYFFGFNKVDIIRNNIDYITDPLWSTGINTTNNKSLNINQSYINGFNTGIQRGFIMLEDLESAEPIYDEDIRIYNCTINGVQNNNGVGISIGLANNYQVSGVKIDLNTISNFKTGIEINNADNFSLGITNNSIIDYELIGISVLNGSEALIKENLINANESEAEDCLGIYVSQVNNPRILSNAITAYNVSNPSNGIVLISSNGEIRNNTIQNHFYAIELGSSSPKIGANTITENKSYGIYISDNSNPDLSGSFVGEDQYPLSGFNTIRENGLCDIMQNSELYLLESSVILDKGCNTIADDRDGVQQQCNNLYLVDGKKIPEMIIKARGNYWGNHPVYGNDPTGRFGEEVTIDYSDYLREPCTNSNGSIELILSNSAGEVYDTVYSTGNTATGLSDIESRYATANEYYYSNNYLQAKQEYEGIIQSYGDSTISLQAYDCLYTIAKCTNSSPSSFTQLKEYYLQHTANQTDSIMIGTLAHLSDLCLVSAGEYISAISNFDEIAQQNPNTDIALYRQIDALTTSLLVLQDSTLNKGLLGKYGVNNLSDYTRKLSELLKTRGKSGLGSGEEILPTEYTLYQNYPNPFNPTTKIKYDLPSASDVTLVIYDILGRKVNELVNTKQQAGRYEVQFNALKLASGVYIYQLIADKHISSKKMILLR